jgi:hypothetical protein
VTAPDNGMEEALRRALAEAVSQVEHGTDALERIRARIARRPPRPWLISIAADVLDRARHWTWRGHWAWQLPWSWPTTVPALSALPWPRLRRLPRPGMPLPGAALLPDPARPARQARLDTVGWLRPMAVLAGIGIIASVSFGVQPFRQAIIQASNTVLTGGQPQSSGGAGTEGSGTPTGDVTSSSGTGTGTGTAPADTYGTTPGRGAIGPGTPASPTPAPSVACSASLLEDLTGLLVYPTADAPHSVISAQPNTATDLAPSPTPTPSPSCAAATSPAPSPTPTPTTTSPTATPTTTSPTATPTGMSPTATPTDTSPTATPTDTSPTPTDSGSDSSTPTPTDTGDTGDGGTPVSATPSATSS